MNVIAKQQELVNFIWGIANLLRGTYRSLQYRRVLGLDPAYLLTA